MGGVVDGEDGGEGVEEGGGGGRGVQQGPFHCLRAFLALNDLSWEHLR